MTTALHCFQSGVEVLSPEQLHLRGSVHVGAGTVLHAAGGIELGAGVVISYHCVLWTINHDYNGDCLPFGLARLRRPIVLGDYVWLGRNVLVAPGSQIGEGAIVAMGAVVSGQVPPLAIVAGNPARVVRFRHPKAYLAQRQAQRTLWQPNGGGVKADLNANLTAGAGLNFAPKAGCGACDNSAFYFTEQGGDSGWHWAWRYLPKRLRLWCQQGIIRRHLLSE